MALSFPASPTDGQTYVGSNGVTYTYDGTKWTGAGGTTAPVTTGGLLRITRYTTSSQFGTWTKPTDVNFILVKLIGGGGRGGTGAMYGGLGPEATGISGGGGGAGGYAEALIRNPAASYAYSIGPGGTVALPSGGDTRFGTIIGRGGLLGTVPGGGAGGNGVYGDISVKGGDGFEGGSNSGGGAGAGGGGVGYYGGGGPGAGGSGSSAGSIPLTTEVSDGNTGHIEVWEFS